MGAYRNDRDAAMLLNESLERDVQDLLRENKELKTKNRSLEYISKELLNGDQCLSLSTRIDALEKENLILSMHNELLEGDPKAVAARQLRAFEQQQQTVYEELHRTYRYLRYVGVCFAVSIASMVLGRLFF